MRKKFLIAITVSASLTFTILLVEITLHILLAPKTLYVRDDTLGWKPKPGIDYQTRKTDADGKIFPVHLTTNEYGFRWWGDTASGRNKVLFIGDSFTGDPNMSDEDAYFGQVARLTDSEIFATGGGGYGTLQELILLEKYAKLIKPDIFILQYCTNDIINNSFNLEGQSIVRNQKNLRPYLVDNRIFYRLPPHHWYRLLNRYSRLFRLADYAVQQMQFKYYDGYFPPRSEQEERAFSEAVAEAKKTTVQIMKAMAGALPGHTRLLTFSCSTIDRDKKETWIQIAEAAGFTPLADVSERVELAERQGITVRMADGGHWNPTGHHFAGKVLADRINNILMDATGL